MGGVKLSGLGRRNGPEGLLRFTESRTIAHDHRLAATAAAREPNSTELSGADAPVLRVLKAVRRR